MAIEMMTPGVDASALDWADEIVERLRMGSPIVFLDYDGTLVPLTDVPSQAVLSNSMRGTLRRLAMECPVALVSGRDPQDLRRKAGLNELLYVGGHGTEVIGPWGHYVEKDAERFLPALDGAESELRYAIGAIRGALVERKRYAVAVHHRLVSDHSMPRLQEAFNLVARRYPELRAITTKRALELRAGTEWDRGRALGTITSLLGLQRPVPLYIGDDATDEEAFRAIGERGVTILVADGIEETNAQYLLTNELEVQQFLELLTDELKK